jgi:hypothetical protein
MQTPGYNNGVFVVVCDPPEDVNTLYGPFISYDKAQEWKDTLKKRGDFCGNDHYILEVYPPELPT